MTVDVGGWDRTLVVLRHAKSDYPPGVPDHDRPLAERGRRDAPVAGDWIAGHVPGPDAVLVSSALRTRETWALAGGRLADPPAAIVEPRMYLASTGEFLAVLSGLPDEVGTVVVVAHNPGCEDVAADLAGPDPDPDSWQRMITKYPTAAIAVLGLSGSWADVGDAPSRLLSFAVPRA
ncbi:MAG: histidine phosphatase family protein [Candidatus Nanopelagicales bacterium]